LKTSAAKEAFKREESFVRVSKWQDGKISDQVHPISKSIESYFIFSSYLTISLFDYYLGAEQTA
jgi:hypothetical protein